MSSATFVDLEMRWSHLLSATEKLIVITWSAFLTEEERRLLERNLFCFAWTGTIRSIPSRSFVKKIFDFSVIRDLKLTAHFHGNSIYLRNSRRHTYKRGVRTLMRVQGEQDYIEDILSKERISQPDNKLVLERAFLISHISAS